LETPQLAPSEEDELSTTPPNPALETEEDTGWKMPKPVFRKTSGYLPQGYAKKYSQNEAKDDLDDDPPTASTEKPVEPVDVGPQPELHESDPGFNYSTVAEQPAKKSGAGKVILTVFLLLLALGLIAVFLGVIYFLFFTPSNDTTF
jgi:hypothetical protein